MNRRQEERVEDLGRAFQSALEEIIEMGNSDIQEDSYLNYTRENEVEREEPIPMPVDMNDKLAQYDVTIKHVHNGFVVGVGCQTFVFESFDKLSKYMAIYYDDPRGTYEKHYKGELLQ